MHGLQRRISEAGMVPAHTNQIQHGSTNATDCLLCLHGWQRYCRLSPFRCGRTVQTKPRGETAVKKKLHKELNKSLTAIANSRANFEHIPLF